MSKADAITYQKNWFGVGEFECVCVCVCVQHAHWAERFVCVFVCVNPPVCVSIGLIYIVAQNSISHSHTVGQSLSLDDQRMHSRHFTYASSHSVCTKRCHNIIMAKNTANSSSNHGQITDKHNTISLIVNNGRCLARRTAHASTCTCSITARLCFARTCQRPRTRSRPRADNALSKTVRCARRSQKIC